MIETLDGRACDACGKFATRWVVAIPLTGGLEARRPSCTACYNRTLRGGNFWMTRKRRQQRRQRMKRIALHYRAKGWTGAQIAVKLGSCESFASKLVRKPPKKK